MTRTTEVNDQSMSADLPRPPAAAALHLSQCPVEQQQQNHQRHLSGRKTKDNSLPLQLYSFQPQNQTRQRPGMETELEDVEDDMVLDHVPLLPRDSYNSNNHHHHHHHHHGPQDTTTTATTTTTTTPSNQVLLGTAFVSFTCFASFQMTFAFVAGSEAMVGDSAAMMVDALTYLFNWLAEAKKNKLTLNPPTMDHARDDDAFTNSARVAVAQREQSRIALEQIRRKKALLQLEIVPPLISVTTLLVVTAYVMHKALAVLWLDWHRDKSEQLDPNINIMLTFSILNLFLDMINVLLFAKAKHAMGFVTTSTTTMDHVTTSNTTKKTRIRNGEHHASLPEFQVINEERNNIIIINNDNDMEEESEENDDDDEDHEANLNMCSAYTHVFADTLRSIAVIVAAAVVKVVPDVTPEEADAAAALVVSILIAASLVPLFQGLYQSISQLRVIQKEEGIVLYAFATATATILMGDDNEEEEEEELDPTRGVPATGAYVFFSNETHPLVVHEFPDITYEELGKVIFERWSALSPDEKKRYQDMAADEKVQFQMWVQ